MRPAGARFHRIFCKAERPELWLRWQASLCIGRGMLPITLLRFIENEADSIPRVNLYRDVFKTREKPAACGDPGTLSTRNTTKWTG